ncbi:MAG: photosynthetic reaction center cytochrome c subunit family protein [Blastocatellia bacterium]
MIKRLILTLVVIALAYDFIAARAQAAQNQSSKNLQVLKGLSPDQVLLLMGEYNLALGQNCDYCHNMKALEKGEKPEHKKALDMIRMTRDINAAIKGSYKIKVDCKSCHQGKARPNSPDVGPPQPDPQQPDPQQPDPQPSVQMPEIVTFRAVALGANQLVFPHAKHISSLDCAKCHHTGETSKCGNCHKHNGGDAKLAFKSISHSVKSDRACAGCHVAMSAGPTKCDQCHRR